MLKRLFLASLILVLSISSLISVTEVQAESGSDVVLTPGDYIEYLEKQKELEDNTYSISSTKEAKNSEEDISAEATLKKFTKLTKGQQKKFIKYLNDPKVTQAIVEGQAELKDGETLKLLKGDIEISSESGVEIPEGFTIAASTRTIWHTFTAKMLGVPLYKTEAKGNYSYTSNGATKANWSDGKVLASYNPTVSIYKTSVDGPGKIVSGRYTATAYFAYHVILAGYGPQIATRYHRVSASKAGTISGASGVY